MSASLVIQRRRRMTDVAMRTLCGVAAFLGAGVLLLLMIHVVINGMAAIRPSLFTELPSPIGMPGGGIAHAIMGSAIIVGMACLWGIPVGLAAGIFLSEHPNPRVTAPVRFAADVLSGVPSIVFGIYAYIIVVTRMGGFSGLAGAFALGVIALPIVARTTEEVLLLVPSELREASLALGVPRWRTIVSVVIPTASTGLITGAMLAVARMAGETAPLIFTTLGNNFWNTDPTRPTAAMTLTIFQYAIWPYENLHQQAWAASLLLLGLVLVINLAVRLAARSRT
ncbi:MAG: phosphate transporter, permease protein PstA [Chloroflexi bacterium]|nr:phosphate transporter, permease protein PstA [Chloroflexota bacterium]